MLDVVATQVASKDVELVDAAAAASPSARSRRSAGRSRRCRSRGPAGRRAGQARRAALRRARRTSNGRSTPTATRRPAAEPAGDGLVATSPEPARRRTSTGLRKPGQHADQSAGREEEPPDVDADRLSASSARTTTRRPRAPRAGRSCTRTTCTSARSGARSRRRKFWFADLAHWPRVFKPFDTITVEFALPLPRPVQHAPLRDPARATGSTTASTTATST